MKLLKRRSFILAFDSLSALAAGAATWALAPLLQTLHHWTNDFAHFMAFANIGFGLFSGILFLFFRKRSQGPFWQLGVLVAGNTLWAIQCFFQAWHLRSEASFVGIGHLILEGVYVGLLAYVETRIFCGKTLDVKSTFMLKASE